MQLPPGRRKHRQRAPVLGHDPVEQQRPDHRVGEPGLQGGVAHLEDLGRREVGVHDRPGRRGPFPSLALSGSAVGAVELGGGSPLAPMAAATPATISPLVSGRASSRRASVSRVPRSRARRRISVVLVGRLPRAARPGPRHRRGCPSAHRAVVAGGRPPGAWPPPGSPAPRRPRATRRRPARVPAPRRPAGRSARRRRVRVRAGRRVRRRAGAAVPRRAGCRLPDRARRHQRRAGPGPAAHPSLRDPARGRPRCPPPPAGRCPRPPRRRPPPRGGRTAGAVPVVCPRIPRPPWR